ncbi:MAG: hypothetical protein OEY81_03000 [Candidatus Bathyarchaeota archaeon]|nr:hypothetical protein [Candidatus Bathyarchaeota archaeon]
MPKSGYKSLNVVSSIHSQVMELAESLDKSVSETIELLLERFEIHQRLQQRSLQDDGWFDRCDPVKTCGECPIQYICWMRKLLTDEEFFQKWLARLDSKVLDRVRTKKT